MELIIKIYQDKPSRIGIKYQYQHQAVKAYEELIRKYPGETLKLRIEIVKCKMNLTFQSNESGVKIYYKALEFGLPQLTKIKALMNSGMPIEFVHIYMERNSPFIAKPFKKQTFFSNNNIEILSQENYTDVM